MSLIPHYDPAEGTLLNFVNEATAEQYLSAGIAHAIRKKNGQIARLYRRVRERAYGTVRDGIAGLHAAASQTTRPVRAGGTVQRAAGQVLGDRRAIREHIPCPGKARRIEFSSCPPMQVTDEEVSAMSAAVRLGREPGLAQDVRPADARIFRRTPQSDPIDTGKLNGSASWT